MNEEEIGTLTPKLFHALLKRKRNADKQAYLRAGMIAAQVINFSMGHPDKPVTELDFVPGWLKEEEDSKHIINLQDLTPEEAATYVKNEMSKRIYTKRK